MDDQSIRWGVIDVGPAIRKEMEKQFAASRAQYAVWMEERHRNAGILGWVRRLLHG